MAVFPGLLVLGVNLIPFVPGKANSGVMNLGSHLCAVIEPNLETRHSDPGVPFLRAFVEIPRCVTLLRSARFLFCFMLCERSDGKLGQRGVEKDIFQLIKLISARSLGHRLKFNFSGQFTFIP